MMISQPRHSYAVLPALIMPMGQTASAYTFAGFLSYVTTIINSVTTLLIVAALVIFFFGATSGLWNEKDAQNHQKMYEFLGWGVGILFLMVSIWGVIRLLQNTLLTNDQGGSTSSGSTSCTDFTSCTFGQ